MAKQPKAYSPEYALARLQALCSRSEKCVYDLQLKLQKWGVSTDDAQKIIVRLQADKFVDEERYAHAYVREKTRFSKWGRQKITQMLKSKRIPSTLIENALAEINQNKYEEELRILLEKKNASIKADTLNERKAKLLRFALSRGYEYQLVYKVLSTISLK